MSCPSRGDWDQKDRQREREGEREDERRRRKQGEGRKGGREAEEAADESISDRFHLVSSQPLLSTSSPIAGTRFGSRSAGNISLLLTTFRQRKAKQWNETVKYCLLARNVESWPCFRVTGCRLYGGGTSSRALVTSLDARTTAHLNSLSCCCSRVTAAASACDGISCRLHDHRAFSSSLAPFHESLFFAFSVPSAGDPQSHVWIRESASITRFINTALDMSLITMALRDRKNGLSF